VEVQQDMITVALTLNIPEEATLTWTIAALLEVLSARFQEASATLHGGHDVPLLRRRGAPPRMTVAEQNFYRQRHWGG